MNSSRISQVWLKVTEIFSVCPTHSWHFNVTVMIPDWESVGCQFEYRKIWFLNETSSVFSLILKLNRKSLIYCLFIRVVLVFRSCLFAVKNATQKKTNRWFCTSFCIEPFFVIFQALLDESRRRVRVYLMLRVRSHWSIATSQNIIVQNVAETEEQSIQNSRFLSNFNICNRNHI